ncbi:MAG: hypothetical protein RIR51_1326 [Bacteroidota bacterium]|jgi:FkbM family methyltransferase
MKIVDKVFGNIYGKAIFQKIFWKIFHFSLKGLNYNIVGSGERNLLKLLQKKISDSPVLFDVGANIGNYTKDLLEYFPNGEIHSFEPIPQTFKKLNSIKLKKGKLNPLGLGKKTEKIKMFYYPEAPTFSSQSEVTNQIYKNEEIEVEFMSLDEYCNENKINKIDFIKIDVEGYEMNVFEGAKFFLSQNKIHIIQFEFGSQQVYSKNFFLDFFNLLNPNYQLYRILKDGLEEIKSYESKHEIFRYANYLAINKNFK